MKKMIFGLCLLLSAGLVMALSIPAKEGRKTNQSPQWYYFNNTGSPYDNDSYGSPSGSASCSGNAVLCAIYALPDPQDSQKPRQADVDAAADASEDFTEEEPGVVEFKSAP